MSTKTKKGNVVNNSSNLPEVEVMDATTTKGKVSTKFNLEETAKVEEQTEKLDKNQVFAEVTDFFCPVRFDASILESSLSPLVESGIMSEDAKNKAIATAKAEFITANKDVIEDANKLSFEEVLEKLKSNQTLYKKVLQVCKVSELSESNYIKDGKVQIFRANQCLDNEGSARYTDVTLTAEENGVKFNSNLFVEYREITTANILLSIRYYASKQEAQKRLFNQISDYRKILDNVRLCVSKAKENGFSRDQVLEVVNMVYAENV